MKTKKRTTTRVRRRSRTNVLEVRVMSPRIAWFGFLKVLGGLTKIACVLAVLAALGWGIWHGIERALFQNPDFRLQVIDLNENPAIDEAGLVEAAGIDLQASLFDLDVEGIAESVAALPEIRDARAERHLPGTLVVRVTAREPRAWIACPEAGIGGERRPGGLMVDADGVVFPCPELQFQSAARLPILRLSPRDETKFSVGKALDHPELVHCFRLLDAAAQDDPESIHGIESIEQTKPWALTLRTRSGTAATFGTGDHERQIANLRAALEHAEHEGYTIGTINLIPKENVPITLLAEAAPPRAIVVPEPTPADLRDDRRARDLNTLLNRD